MDDKSKAVQIAEYQKKIILRDIETILDGYVRSVELGTAPRKVTYSIEAENLVSLTNAELTPPSVSL